MSLMLMKYRLAQWLIRLSRWVHTPHVCQPEDHRPDATIEHMHIIEVSKLNGRIANLEQDVKRLSETSQHFELYNQQLKERIRKRKLTVPRFKPITFPR